MQKKIFKKADKNKSALFGVGFFPIFAASYKYHHAMKLDLSHTMPFLDNTVVNNLKSRISATYKTVFDKTGLGNDFLAWVGLPSGITDDFLADIEQTAAALRKKSEIFVVVGIGGSYLGARAVIEALQNHFAPFTGEKPLVVYAGHNMSEDYL